MTARLERARRAWRRILSALRTEPISDARKIAGEIEEDLDALFPRPRPEDWRGTGPARSRR